MASQSVSDSSSSDEQSDFTNNQPQKPPVAASLNSQGGGGSQGSNTQPKEDKLWGLANAQMKILGEFDPFQ